MVDKASLPDPLSFPKKPASPAFRREGAPGGQPVVLTGPPGGRAGRVPGEQERVGENACQDVALPAPLEGQVLGQSQNLRLQRTLHHAKVT